MILSRYINFAERHTGALLLFFLALAIVAAGIASGLGIQTDMAQLLPSDHPSVVALQRISGRQKSATNLVVIIQSKDPMANQRYLEALRPKLSAMIPEVFTEIQWKPDTELPEYFSRWRFLYAEKEELERAESFVDRILQSRKNPMFVDLEGDPEEELRKLRKSMEDRLPKRNDAPGFSNSEDGIHYLGFMLWRKRDGLGSLGDHQTLKTVQGVVASIPEKDFHPTLKVRYTGHIAMAVDQQNAVREDIVWATAICVSLVLISIYLYFTRIGILAVVGAPAFLGVLLALALARIALKDLNVNTAFLISIILGNGINTPIILLARFGEERRRGIGVREAMTLALTHTALGTATAMLAAGIAYGSLLFTTFRGFNQFGLIGGAGMLMVWFVSFLMVPPLIFFGERLRPGLLTPGINLWRVPFSYLGVGIARVPVPVLLVCLILLGASVKPLATYAKDPLEWNFENLRSDPTESDKLWGRMEMMGMGDVGAGYIGNNGVLLVDRPEQADPVAEAMRKKDRDKGKDHLLKEVRTINSMLPKEQETKLVLLKRVRDKIDRNRDLISDEEWRDLEKFRPPDYLRKLTTADLPRLIREAFTEVDGTVGRLVGIDADPTVYYDWDGHSLLKLSDAITVQAEGKTWMAASVSTIFGGMVETILKDSRPVTLIALGAVALLVIVTFGPIGAVPVLLTLAVGMTWLGALLHLYKLKLNFMNFVAVPITIGVGADYAANLWARLRQEGSQNTAAILADTGSAVALCSATTIIGYSSLLQASNRALRSFGLLANLGEVTCLLAALLFLPTCYLLISRPKGKTASVDGESLEGG